MKWRHNGNMAGGAKGLIFNIKETTIIHLIVIIIIDLKMVFGIIKNQKVAYTMNSSTNNKVINNIKSIKSNIEQNIKDRFKKRAVANYYIKVIEDDSQININEYEAWDQTFKTQLDSHLN